MIWKTLKRIFELSNQTSPKNSLTVEEQDSIATKKNYTLKKQKVQHAYLEWEREETDLELDTDWERREYLASSDKLQKFKCSLKHKHQ